MPRIAERCRAGSRGIDPTNAERSLTRASRTYCARQALRLRRWMRSVWLGDTLAWRSASIAGSRNADVLSGRAGKPLKRFGGRMDARPPAKRG